MHRSAPLFLFIAASLAAGFWLATRVGRRPSNVTPSPAELAQRPAEFSLPASLVPRESPALVGESGAAAETAGEVLEAYYGAAWPGVRARLETAGVRLDVPFSLTPWNEVEAEFRGLVGVDETMRKQILLDRFVWTEELTNDWLREQFPGVGDFELAPEELAQLEALIEPDRLTFEVVAQAFCERLEFHLRAAFEQGRYQRVPYTNQGLTEESGFYSTALAGHGWAVSLTLHEEHCPDVGELQQEMQAIVHQRDRLVARFLREHPRR